MGMEFTFSTKTRNPLRKRNEVWSEVLVDLFESPDLLLEMGYRDFEEMRQAGYFPGFVEAYRENFGSSRSLELIEDDVEREKQIKQMADKVLAEMLGDADPDEPAEDEIKVDVNPEEVKQWAGSWIEVLTDANDEVRELFLPYNHACCSTVIEDLRSLVDLAVDAEKHNANMRLRVLLG